MERAANGWSHLYRSGRRLLARHRPQAAVAPLSEAVARCPAAEREAAAAALVALGLALERSGHRAAAVRSYLAARRLVRGGAAERAVRRTVNAYGMPRQANAQADDFQAFRSVQMARCLAGRPAARLDCAELEAAEGLIVQAFRLLSGSGLLKPLDTAAKLALFQRARVAFPLPAMPAGGETIRGSFRGGSAFGGRVEPSDRCVCGSGRPYLACCGRIPSCQERFAGR